MRGGSASLDPRYCQPYDGKNPVLLRCKVFAMSIINLGAAAAAVTDPATPAADLAQIATDFPVLRPQVAAHPNAYPGLLDWLIAQGDPTVAAVVAARRPVAAPQPPAHYTNAPRPHHSHVAAFVATGAGVIVVVCALLIWLVIVPKASSQTQAPTGDILANPTWEQIPLTGQIITYAPVSKPTEMVVATLADANNVALNGVDVQNKKVLWTTNIIAVNATPGTFAVDMNSDTAGHVAVAVQETSGSDGSPWHLAVLNAADGSITSSTETYIGIGGVYGLYLGSNMLIIAELTTTVAYSANDLSHQAWSVDSEIDGWGWVGDQYITTKYGVARVSDGQPAPFGSDANRSPIYYGGPDTSHVLRVQQSGCNDTIPGWSTASDSATWGTTVTISATGLPVYDNSGVYLLTGGYEGSNGIGCGVNAGDAVVIGYSWQTGQELWQQPLPEVSFPPTGGGNCYLRPKPSSASDQSQQGEKFMMVQCSSSNTTYMFAPPDGSVQSIAGSYVGSGTSVMYFQSAPDGQLSAYSSTSGTLNKLWSIDQPSGVSGDGAWSAQVGPNILMFELTDDGIVGGSTLYVLGQG